MADMIFEEDYDNDGEMTSIVIVMMMMMVMIKTKMMTMVNRNIFILSCSLCQALGQCRRAKKNKMTEQYNSERATKGVKRDGESL